MRRAITLKVLIIDYLTHLQELEVRQEMYFRNHATQRNVGSRAAHSLSEVYTIE